VLFIADCKVTQCCQVGREILAQQPPKTSQNVAQLMGEVSKTYYVHIMYVQSVTDGISRWVNSGW